MKLLHKSELENLLNQSDSEILQYAKDLIESNNAVNWQKANELSFLLRKNNRHDLSVEISHSMFEKDKTVDKLNLYFVAVVDQGDIDKIRELHTLVDRYVQELNGCYQKHLFATWLKAANRILDDQMFDYVYGMVPSAEKVENSYIISQYYVYLNRHSKYADVKEHFENQLKPHIQNSEYVRRYYQNACERLGYSYKKKSDSQSNEALTQDNLKVDNTEDKSTKNKRVFFGVVQ